MLVTWAEFADIAANVADTSHESKKGIPASRQPPGSGIVEEARRSGRKEEALLEHRRIAGVCVSWRRLNLARIIRDFIGTKGLAMVQIRCLRGFETKSEAFA